MRSENKENAVINLAKQDLNASLSILSSLDSENLSSSNYENLKSLSAVQLEIEKEQQRLAKNIELLSNSTKEWLKALKELNSAVKEQGDLQNYAGIIEQDVKLICDTLMKT